MVQNKNLKTVSCFSSEVTLNEQEKQVSPLAGDSESGEPTTVKFFLNLLQACILTFWCLKGLWQWKQVAVTNGNYNNIFYKTQLFCLSYFLIKWYILMKENYILCEVKLFGAVACPH